MSKLTIITLSVILIPLVLLIVRFYMKKNKEDGKDKTYPLW